MRLPLLAREPRRWRSAAARAVLLVAGLTSPAGCSLSAPVPNARLVCEGDWQCPAGHVCQANASVKVCCVPGTCAGEADGPTRPAPGTPDAAIGAVLDAAAPNRPTDAGVSAKEVSPEAAAPLDGGGPTLEQACTEYARVSCAHLGQCEPGNKPYGGDDICRARTLIACEDAYAPMADAHLGPVFVARCARALDTPGTSCLAFRVSNRVLPGCVPEPGDLPIAAPCSSFAQCQSLTCTANHACGVCIPAPAVGDPCQDDSQCLQTSAHRVLCGPKKTCVEAGGINDVCGPERPCNDLAFFCGNNGRCEQRRSVDAPCTDTQQCDVGSSLACAPTAPGSTTMTCQPIRRVEVGGDCGQPLNHCTGSDWCNPDLQCTPTAPDGHPCRFGLDDECLFPAWCDNGICTLPVRPRCPVPTSVTPVTRARSLPPA